ncbi:MAG: hypothetical protein P8J27_15735 [Mariniblastus sp.]|nr:hypothetical protein [Mariniblastus sp.]
MTDPETSTATADNTLTISTKTTDQSKPFIGQWNNLISTTNWEKGEIICQWRDSLKAEGVSASDSSDEAWSQLVGGVTPQHVGRLRRTSEKYGHTFKEYEGIYWSHFYASLDWDDAEMWLEGAVQNKWSVSGMRQQRWETLGKVGDAPDDGEIVRTEAVEETQSMALSENTRSNDRDYIDGPVHEGPDWGDDSPSSGKSKSDEQSDQKVESEAEPVKPHAVRPFESFTDLPGDIEDLANSFKVAIIRHKAQEWDEISQEDMVGLLDALKQLAELAPV